ncbi:hypothetical protein KKB18_12385 [bacterium]|nr:hypothetical protein [bacterium]
MASTTGYSTLDITFYFSPAFITILGGVVTLLSNHKGDQEFIEKSHDWVDTNLLT